MAGPTGFPVNAISFIPGGPVVINVSALGSNNAISFQLFGEEIANINQSGVLSTAGGGGLSGFGAFGSTPNANGGSVSGSNIVLQPADGTHPGGVSTAAQTFAGVKTFSSVPIAAGLTAPSGALAFTSGAASAPITFTDGASTLYGKFAPDPIFGEPALFVGTQTYLFGADGVATFLNGAVSLTLGIGNAQLVTLHSTNFDFSGLGNGGAIKLKSPDGTTYTLSVANGGTLLIT
jgi:hypothetical protein